jgi:hypothetical protein
MKDQTKNLKTYLQNTYHLMHKKILQYLLLILNYI